MEFVVPYNRNLFINKRFHLLPDTRQFSKKPKGKTSKFMQSSNKRIKFYISIAISLILIVFLPSIQYLQAQALHQGSTVIQGKITDANTNEPIPFANVFFKETTIGTTSDFDGRFKLETNTPGDSITVRVISYKLKSKKVKKGINQTIDFQLEPTSFELEEVVIKAGENPAYPIIRKARENRKFYNPESLDAYEYKSYVKIDISFDQINENFKNSKTFKPYAALLDSLRRAAGEEGKLVIPFFVSEQINEVYYRKEPKRNKTIVKASRMDGLIIDNYQILESYLGKTMQEFNFYNNIQEILDRSFITPLASGSFAYYDYFIMDTVLVDNDSCYELKVKPRRPLDLAFTGKIWIDTKNYALRRLDLEITSSVNINFIDKYKVQQDYEKQSTGHYLPTKTRVLVDLQQTSDSAVGFIGKYYIANKDYVMNQPRPLSFYDNNVEVDMAARTFSDEFWDEQRKQMITDHEQVKGSLEAIDSLKKSPQLTRIRKALRIIWDGYYNFGKVELGHWYTMFGNNPIEGFRFQASVRTNINWNYYWILSGYGAYGFKDEKFKYRMQVERFLDRNKWRKVGIRYSYDMMRLGVDPEFLESHVFLNYIFLFSSQFGYLNRMSLSQDIRLWYETDHWRGWNTKVMLKTKTFHPQGDYYFGYYDDNNNIQTKYRTTEFHLISSYSRKRTWLVENNWRASAEALKSPLWTFHATIGFKNFLGSDFTFQKLSLNVMHKWRTGYFGQLDYSLTGEVTLGKVPYPEAIIPQGNEPVFAAEKAYNMMNFFEFVADKSVSGIFLHHFDGLFFNRIPLLKRLKWREVVGFNFIFSTYEKKNYIRTADNPEGLLASSINGNPVTEFRIMDFGKPYMEVSYGIENILKIIRIQAFHRLSYLDPGPDGKKVPKFMIKASFFIRL